MALSIVLEMNDPSIFDENQTYELRQEMIHLFENILSDLSLLKATVLFVRCYSSMKIFSTNFQHTINIILNKFDQTSSNIEKEALFN